MSRLGTWSLVAVCVLLRLTPPWEINHDVGWLLFVADRVLHGAGLYSDLVEVNPPLIVYLSVPPAAFAEWTGLGVGAAFNLWVTALLVFSLWLTRRVFGSGRAVLSEPVALAAAAFVLVVPVGRDFGQREHLMVILTLPYFAAVAMRVAGGEVRSSWAFVTGVWAAVGFSLKPFFFLAPALVWLGTLVRQRRLFDRRRAENEGLIVGVLAYLAHFFFVPFQSDFVASVELALEVYGSFEVSFAEFVRRPWVIEALVVTALLMIATIFTRRERVKLRVLMFAQLGFLVAAFWQRKGWSYHLFPAFACGYLGLVVLVFGSGVRWLRAAFLVACLVYVALPIGQHWLQREPELSFADEFSGIAPEFDAVRELKPGDAVLVLDTDMHTFFAWMVDRDIGWASRYACLWPLPGGPPQRRAELRREVLGDIERHAPALVFVRRGSPSFTESGFDIATWLGEDWTAAYDERQNPSAFRAWRRR